MFALENLQERLQAAAGSPAISLAAHPGLPAPTCSRRQWPAKRLRRVWMAWPYRLMEFPSSRARRWAPCPKLHAAQQRRAQGGEPLRADQLGGEWRLAAGLPRCRQQHTGPEIAETRRPALRRSAKRLPRLLR